MRASQDRSSERALAPAVGARGDADAGHGPLSALARHLDAVRSGAGRRRSRRSHGCVASVTEATFGEARRAKVAPAKAPPKASSSQKPASDVLAGALARAASQSTIHPIDTIKVRMQSSTGAGVSKFSQLVPPSGMSGLRSAVGQAVPRVASLYAGCLGAASGAGIAIGAYFACYGVAHNAISRSSMGANMQPGAVAFFAGAAAAAGSSVVKVPIAVCIRSVQAGKYPNALAAGRSIVSGAGAKGLFTGFVPTVLEDIPDMAFKFAAYETLRQVHHQFKGDKASPSEDFAMGAVAGAFAAAATTPLDVVKTNMMVNAAARPSMAQAARAVLGSSGLPGFFRGVGPRALSNGINSAVFFCFFEALSTVFREKSQRRQALQLQKRAAQAQRRAAVQESLDHELSADVLLAAQPASITVSRRGPNNLRGGGGDDAPLN